MLETRFTLMVLLLLQAAPASGEITEDAEHWVLRSTAVEVRVRKSDGSIHEVQSNEPSPLSVAPGGMWIYLNYPDIHSGLGVVRADKLVSSEIQRTEEGESLLCRLGFSNKHVKDCAVASVTYRLKGDLVLIRVEVEGKSNFMGHPDVGFGLKYDTESWFRHWYMNLYFDEEFDFKKNRERATKPRFLQFDQDPDDLLFEENWHHWLAMPMGALEREDRYMLWGSLDLGRHGVLAPNYQGLIPSFLFRPGKGIEGKTFVFDAFVKFASKKDHDYIDVHRWYAQNVYSTNPITAGIVAMPRDLEYRNVTPGNIGCICIYDGPWGTLGRQDDYWKFYEDYTIESRAIHQWFGDWQTWDGRLPTEGRWYASHSGELQVSAEELKDYIARLQKRGLKFYAYMRQLFANGRMYEDKPPYLRWMKKDSNGLYMPYPCGNRNDYARGWHEISDEQAKRWGIDREKLAEIFPHGKLGWLYADFDNPEFREWYIRRTKAAIEYYNLDGISWDVAWNDIHRGIHHGVLRVQYEIYTWLKRKYPDKKILTNMAHGNPSQLYADMVYMEGTGWSGKRRAIEAGLAYKTALNAPVVYADMQTNLDEVRKCLSLGMTWFSHFGMPDGRENLPKMAALTDLVNFSARANSVPAITEQELLSLSPGDPALTATLWGRGDDLLLAVYRHAAVDSENGDSTVRVRIDPGVLQKAGVTRPTRLKMRVIGKDGHPTQRNDFEYLASPSSSLLEIRGALGKDELLLATTPPR